MSDLLEQHKAHVADADAKSLSLTQSAELAASPAEWHKRKVLAFDLETTGVDVNKARILTASIVECFGNPFSADTVVVREWMVNPGIDIPAASSRIHGISNEMVQKKGLPPELAVQQIVDILRANMTSGVPVIGYNTSYDFTVLDRECKRLGIKPLTEDEIIVIDPLVIDYKLQKYRSGSRKLVDNVRHYGLPEFNAHDASADCIVTIQLAYTMAQHFYPSHLLLAPETLCSVQKNWKKEWADGRNEWAASKGKPTNYSAYLTVVPE